MTEQKDNSAMPEQTTEIASATQQSESAVKTSDGGNKLAFVAIVIAIALGAGSFIYVQHQGTQQSAQIQALNETITQLRERSTAQDQQISDQLAAANKALQEGQLQQQTFDKTLGSLQEKVTSLTGNDRSLWLISAADYFVKLAERKLWSDQDTTTATLLLKSADNSLAQLDDPSVLHVRRALTQDISTLSNFNQIDYDGIILQLNQLTDNVDNLRLAENADEDAQQQEESSNSISHSLAHWRQNLLNSWHDFMDNFITIRRRDNTAQPLLAPDQEIYLRENIRSRLLVAAQAVPRHQDEVYKQSLEAISTWVRAWYDVDDSTTKAFLSQIEQLEQQSINMDLPDALTSQPLIETLLRARNHGQMTSVANPAAPAPQGE